MMIDYNRPNNPNPQQPQLPITPEEKQDFDSLIDLASRIVVRFEYQEDCESFFRSILDTMKNDDEKSTLIYLTESSGRFEDIGKQVFENLKNFDRECPLILETINKPDFIDWLHAGLEPFRNFVFKDYLPKRNLPTSPRKFIYNQQSRDKVEANVQQIISASYRYKSTQERR